MPTKNIVFVALPPHDSAPIQDTIDRAHRLRNKFCELELAKRDRYYAILRDHAPVVLDAEAAIADAVRELTEHRDAIQAAKVEQRTKTPTGIDTHKAAVKALKLRLRILRAGLKAARLAAQQNPTIRAAITESDAKHKADRKQAEVDSGLFWGTRGYVARRQTQSFASGAPPKFRRWNGGGKAAMQLQKGLNQTRAFDCSDNRLRLELPDAALEKLYDGQRIGTKESEAICRLRIGLDGRSPIFAEITVRIPRLLPEGGKIKWAFIERNIRTVYGSYRDDERSEHDVEDEWRVRLEVEVPDDTIMADIDAPTVAIRTGWTATNEGIVAMRWTGSAGRTGRIVVPPADVKLAVEILPDQRAAIDREFNEIRDWFAGQLLTSDVPDWISEACEHIRRWKSSVKLSGIVMAWKKEGGSGEVFDRLWNWRARNKRERQSVASRSRKLSRRHKDRIRCALKQLRTDYPIAMMPKITVKQLTANPLPEDCAESKERTHKQARIASPGVIMQLVKEYWGPNLIDVPYTGIAQTCHRCGEIRKGELPAKIQCKKCHRTITPAQNAMANIRARGETIIKDGGLLANRIALENKELKRRERLAKMQAARRAKVRSRKEQKGAVT